MYINIREKSLLDVNFKMGLPYLYRHGNKCDHLFIISEARLFDEQKDLDLMREPIIKCF